jgi:hypothetical protein
MQDKRLDVREAAKNSRVALMVVGDESRRIGGISAIPDEWDTIGSAPKPRASLP